MSFKTFVRRLINRLGYGICEHYHWCYDQECFITIHHHDFMDEPRFKEAYARASEMEGGEPPVHWRTHVAVWLAEQAFRLDGDFVECGVYNGFTNHVIMHYNDWNQQDRSFFMFDTFEGLVEHLLNDEERKIGRIKINEKLYSESVYEQAAARLEEFDRVHLVRGAVPDTLNDVKIDRVAYLSLDMNCAGPEIAALRHFWPKLVAGGVVLLDDYAFRGFEPQLKAHNELAEELGYSILSLPTGQGIILKP